MSDQSRASVSGTDGGEGPRYVPPSAYVAGRGFLLGPSLAPDEPPWPSGWEQQADLDAHEHEWESVLLEADGQRRLRIEECVRCRTCHSPRCGHSRDPDPCMERRHHRGAHSPLSHGGIR